jgi:RNA polymerase sigma-70 factor (ECF subfamily)
LAEEESGKVELTGLEGGKREVASHETTSREATTHEAAGHEIASQESVTRDAAGRLDPVTLAALYVEHADELSRFLIGVLRDGHLASDVVQTTFAKAAEQGHTAKNESLKSWLFTVAYHEAMLVRRREGAAGRAIEQKALWQQSHDDCPTPEGPLVRWETVKQVRQALRGLPAEQAEVVRRRMFDGQKFADIAAGLGLPLGTVLSRMRTALAKLREKLRDE